MASDFPPEAPPPTRDLGRRVARTLKESIADSLDGAAQKAAAQASAERAARMGRQRREEKAALKSELRAEIKAEVLRHIGEHVRAGAEVWTRSEPGRRKPRFTREEIAHCAMALADAEGVDALSMRRIAMELDAGTMTLYHYVRTKDELLALVNDAVMAESLVPPDAPVLASWRDRIVRVAHHTRAMVLRHPWLFDIADDPPLGPNTLRHFDQSMHSVAGLDLPLVDRLDIVATVDEYVLGYCLLERNNRQPGDDAAPDAAMVEYVERLIATGEYPDLEELAGDRGIAEVWEEIGCHIRDERRFERNLNRLLDGIAASFGIASP